MADDNQAEWTKVLAEALNNPGGREQYFNKAKTIQADLRRETERAIQTTLIAGGTIAVAGTYTLRNQADYNWLNFACGLRINCATGEVVIPEDLDLDEAWRQFWEGVARMHPSRERGFGER